MKTEIKSSEVLAYVNTCKAIAEAVRELGEVPSGHLYAHLMGQMSLDTYEGMIAKLINAGLIRKSASHMLSWVTESGAK